MRKALLVTLFFLWRSFVWAMDAPVILNAEVDKAKVTTGDVITFSVILDKDKSLKNVELYDFGDKIQAFRIIEFGADGPQEDNGRIVAKKWYKLRADITGSYVLPSIELKYFDNDKKEQVVKTSEVFVEVESVLPKDGEAAKDIRDIKPSFSMGYSLSILSWILIGFLMFLLLAFPFYLYFKRRSQIVIEKIIPPHVVAIEGLTKIKETDFDKNFFFELSEIIRTYFEKIFNIRTSDMTTEEIRKNLNSFLGVSLALKGNFLHILTECDIVKFTDINFEREKSEKLLDMTFKFIEETKPVDEVEEESVV